MGRVTRPWETSPSKPRRLLLQILLSAQPGVTSHSWACFIGLEMALRTHIFVFSLAVWVGAIIWLRHGYNARMFAYPPSRLPEDQYQRLLQQGVLLLATEVLNTFAMELWFRRR